MNTSLPPAGPALPVVSLITPAWNVAPYISQAIQSARSQTLQNIEIIVIQNGSTDGTAAEIARHAEDPRLVVLESPVNLGPGAGRNLGLQVARGKYLAFLDGDDWLQPDALAQAVAAAERDAADLVLFGYIRWTPRRRKVHFPPLLSGDLESDRCKAITGTLALCMRLLRRDLIEQQALKFPEGRYEDMAWSIRTAMTATQIVAVRQPLYVYRKRPGSTLMSRSLHHWDALAQWRAIAQAVNDAQASRPIRRAVAQAMARQTRRIFVSHRLPRASEATYFQEAGDIIDAFCRGDWPNCEAQALGQHRSKLYWPMLFPARAINRISRLRPPAAPPSA